MTGIIPASVEFHWPTIPMEGWKVVALTQSLMDAGVEYGLGAKADPLSLQVGGFDKIDCSGFVRWCIWHATAGAVTIVDGSANQHVQIKSAGFKPSDYDAAKNHDEAIRIAFLSPAQSSDGIGHVLLVVDGLTCESHGGHGPDRRDWGSRPYHALMDVYVLTAPKS